MCHVPACKLSMILYYKAREPCIARVLSSAVQYVKLVLQLAIEFSVRGCIIHHGYNSRRSTENPIRFLISEGQDFSLFRTGFLLPV